MIVRVWEVQLGPSLGANLALQAICLRHTPLTVTVTLWYWCLALPTHKVLCLCYRNSGLQVANLPWATSYSVGPLEGWHCQ